jgi:hypothetical protein
MPLRQTLTTLLLCILAFTIHPQPPSWTSATCGKLSLHYPPTWHLTHETRASGTRITLTPDSMQQLSMHMMELYDIHLDAQHTYSLLKKQAIQALQESPETKMVKTVDITFKGRQGMCLEFIQNSLPGKMYWVNGGTELYWIIIIPRRYIGVPDPGLERDETAMMNSISFPPSVL